MRTAGKEVVRARQEEPFLECFIEAYQPFILRTASKYAGFLLSLIHISEPTRRS